jgi:4-carboxymuconolactone decarboxylase
MIAVLVTAWSACRGQQSSTVTDPAALPADVYADSRNRLPLIRREELSEEGKALYDRSASKQGPPQPSTEIKLYSPHLEALIREPSEFIRTRNGLRPRLTELAILVTAREFDQQYEWTVHEKTALKAGIPQKAIDVVKYRRAVSGLSEEESSIIGVGPELFGQHKVTPATFAAARKLFGPERLVNLVWLMGHYAATAALLTTFDQQLPAQERPLLPVPCCSVKP